MSDNRTTGPRDIKDLKARLGLKPAAAPAAQAPGQQPGMPAAVPPPFGPPPGVGPAQPAPPDLTRDPFAVQVAAPVVQPKVDFEIPKEWTNEAGPGAKEKSAITPILIYVAIALVPLIVGYACGRINGGRADVNQTIEHAKKIKKEVDGFAATNQKVEAAFDASMGRAGKPGAALPDMAFVDEIKALNLAAPGTDTIFRSNYYHMKDLAIERLFNYYYATIQLYERANVHVRRTEADKELLEKYAKQAAANKETADQTFGITIDPSGPIPVGKLVMVGEVVCKKEFKDGCQKPNQWDGFWVKSDNTATAVKRMLYTTKEKENERVIPIDKTTLFQKVIVGSPEALAAEAYGRRLKEIKDLIEKLKPARKDLLKELEDQSGKSKLFAL